MGSKHLETIEALRLRRRAFFRFSVFETPDENLALVFDLLHQIIIAGIFNKKTSPYLVGLFLLAVWLDSPSAANLSDFFNPRGSTNKEKRLIGKSP